MTAKLNREAESDVLETLCRGLMLRFFANDIYPRRGDAFERYEEPNGGGYFPQRIPDELWGQQRGDVSRNDMKGLRVEFGGTVGILYGYFVTDDANSVRWSERFSDGPYQIGAGDFIELDMSLFVEQGD